MSRISISRAIYWSIILTAAIAGWSTAQLFMNLVDIPWLPSAIKDPLSYVVVFMSLPAFFFSTIVRATYSASSPIYPFFNALIWALIAVWFLRKWRRIKIERRAMRLKRASAKSAAPHS